ncbi:MAG: hypothetical protein CVU24_02875 [Betaproteobacteria bacterium HGW-Betaproteobacteria-18]|nr:MAG: hypothetical protein CVU24_02875 [Betaproteobacteria bacterium HGW-Betaproteobacteria-18]
MNQSVIFSVSCLLAVAAVAPLAQAEPEIIKAIPLQVHEERLRIQKLRLEYEAIDQQAQADCYAKFAVSDCLRAARAKKRFVLDDLRRQEVILNDLDRHTKAIEALNKIQEKSLADAKRLDAKP